jgi:hypothetical protein
MLQIETGFRRRLLTIASCFAVGVMWFGGWIGLMYYLSHFGNLSSLPEVGKMFFSFSVGSLSGIMAILIGGTAWVEIIYPGYLYLTQGKEAAEAGHRKVANIWWD